MGGCCSCDATPDAPENIIDDPENGTQQEFTIQKCGWTGLSRDYQAFRGLDDPAEENRWLFLNKSGSSWGGNCKIAVENFVRGGNPDAPEEGEILWEADFIDDPYFQQYMRDPQVRSAHRASARPARVSSGLPLPPRRKFCERA